MAIKPIINLATKYTDDIIGFGVRKWTKPTTLECLRLVGRVQFIAVRSWQFNSKCN